MINSLSGYKILSCKSVVLRVVNAVPCRVAARVAFELSDAFLITDPLQVHWFCFISGNFLNCFFIPCILKYYNDMP